MGIEDLVESRGSGGNPVKPVEAVDTSRNRSSGGFPMPKFRDKRNIPAVEALVLIKRVVQAVKGLKERVENLEEVSELSRNGEYFILVTQGDFPFEVHRLNPKFLGLVDAFDSVEDAVAFKIKQEDKEAYDGANQPDR